MSCPYCYGTLELYKRVTYACYDGTREIQWVRCTRCEHKTLAPAQGSDGTLDRQTASAA